MAMGNWMSNEFTRDLDELIPLSEGGSTPALNAPAAPLASGEPYRFAVDDTVDASRRVPRQETNLYKAASWGSGARWSGEQLANLVRDAAQGEVASWYALVDRLAPLVWSVIRGYRLGAHDAADVSQTTWLRLAQHIGRLHQPERVAAWCATTASRECLALLRRSRRQVPTDDAYLPKVFDEDPAAQPETSTLRGEEQTELWHAFLALPARSQLLLRLLFADPPLSYQEIASATDMAVGSIGPTRSRVLGHLRRR